MKEAGGVEPYFVYVPCRAGCAIEVFAVSPDIDISHVQSVSLAGNGLPMVLNSEGTRAYASVTYPLDRGEVSFYEVFEVDRASGRLTRMQRVWAPNRISHVSLDRGGRFLLSVSLPGDMLISHPILPDGRISPEPSFAGPTARMPHQVLTTPDNRMAYVPCMGGDRLMQWRFDASTGVFAPHEEPFLGQERNSGPRHGCFSPDGFRYYLLRELDGAVICYDLLAGANDLSAFQTASALGRTVAGDPWAAEIRVTPDGRFLYASERRGSTIAWWPIDARGRLGERRLQVCEAEPRGFDVSPDGKMLVIAGGQSSTCGFYRLNPADGAPVRIAMFPTARQPSFLITHPA